MTIPRSLRIYTKIYVNLEKKTHWTENLLNQFLALKCLISANEQRKCAHSFLVTMDSRIWTINRAAALLEMARIIWSVKWENFICIMSASLLSLFILTKMWTQLLYGLLLPLTFIISSIFTWQLLLLLIKYDFRSKVMIVDLFISEFEILLY